MLRCGIFENFKSAEVMLLIAGGKCLTQLALLFRALAEGRSSVVKMNELPWVHAEPGCCVTLSLATGACSDLTMVRTGNAVSITCDLTRDELIDFAEKVEVLAAPKCDRGHQYLDVLGDYPFEIMVSKNEYRNGWPSA